MDKNFWIHTLAGLIGLIHGPTCWIEEFLDTHINKTYWIYTFTDLLDTYMNNNSWTHTLTRLIGFIYG